MKISNNINMRFVLDEFVFELGEMYKDLFYLTADGSMSKKFGGSYPTRFIDVGIAEQNLINIAGGLALSGKKVLVSSVASFVTTNAYMQIRDSLCYPDLNVSIVGFGAGLAYGSLGATHHTLEDIAILRVLPNMKIFLPCDVVEAQLAIAQAIELEHPCYIRLSNHNMLLENNQLVNFNDINILNVGKKMLVISMGLTLVYAKEIVNNLKLKGIDIGLVNINSINIYENDKLSNILKSYEIIMTIEEHFVKGGIGSYISEVLAEFKIIAKLYSIGVKNEFCSIAGSYADLMGYYGLGKNEIMKQISKIALEE